MNKSVNCAWAHHINGVRFEAVPIAGDDPHWRLFNRTHGVLMGGALPWARAASRGQLLMGLDRTAETMGIDAFMAAVAPGHAARRRVTLIRSGGGFRQEVGRLEVTFPADIVVNDVLQFALYELIAGDDTGHGVLHAVVDEPQEESVAA